MIQDYKEIDGMFGYEDIYTNVIEEIYNGERLKIVEIGAWKGCSSFFLGENNHDKADIWIIDRWEGTFGGETNGQLGQMLEQFEHNMEKWEGKYTAIISDSAKGAEHFKDNELDFVFIDADHSFEAVSADIKAWLPKVKPTGIIGGHDYNIYQGVNDAVSLLIGSKIKIYNNSWIANIKDIKL